MAGPKALRAFQLQVLKIPTSTVIWKSRWVRCRHLHKRDGRDSRINPTTADELSKSGVGAIQVGISVLGRNPVIDLLHRYIERMAVTDLEISALWAQWIGAGAAVGAVLVAVLFGYLTLANAQRSKDTQERATLTASTEPLSADFAAAVVAASRVQWRVEPNGGERWLLVHDGSTTAYGVRIAGLTELDKRRLTSVPAEQDIAPTGTLPFTLVSRLTLSGPSNVVVTFALESGAERVRQVVRVPAP